MSYTLNFPALLFVCIVVLCFLVPSRCNSGKSSTLVSSQQQQLTFQGMKKSARIATRQKVSSLEVEANTAVVARTKNHQTSGWKQSLEVATYLGLWYLFSGYYNIYNKKALNILKLPWFVATSQMGMGFLIFLPMWLFNLRKRPANSLGEFGDTLKSLSSVGFYQALTHASGVIALGAGAVSFTQVVKASEPAFTAAISAFFFSEYLPWQCYTALIPVMIGVSMASVTELTFSWFCLGAGMMANIFAAARGVFGKKQMCGETDVIATLSKDNYYAVLTIVSFLMLVPVTVLMEGKRILSLVSIANYQEGIKQMLISGILFYLYNEVSFRALNSLNPVSHALANTVKRIVIILSSVILMGETMTPIGTTGASLAMLGVFLYSMAGIYYKKKKE